MGITDIILHMGYWKCYINECTATQNGFFLSSLNLFHNKLEEKKNIERLAAAPFKPPQEDMAETVPVSAESNKEQARWKIAPWQGELHVGGCIRIEDKKTSLPHAHLTFLLYVSSFLL